MAGTKSPLINKVAFLERLEKLAEQLGCQGKVSETPPFKQERLSLEQILALQIMCSSTDSVALTLELGADPNYINSKGKSLMQLAQAYERQDIMQLLVKHGAEIAATPRKRKPKSKK